MVVVMAMECSEWYGGGGDGSGCVGGFCGVGGGVIVLVNLWWKGQGKLEQVGKLRLNVRKRREERENRGQGLRQRREVGRSLWSEGMVYEKDGKNGSERGGNGRARRNRKGEGGGDWEHCKRRGGERKSRGE